MWSGLLTSDISDVMNGRLSLDGSEKDIRSCSVNSEVLE